MKKYKVRYYEDAKVVVKEVEAIAYHIV